MGAGPAGSIAALALARAGVRVRLIDRARFPRDKLCGDTVNPGALALLDTVGIGDSVRAHGQRITGMTVSGPGGARIVAEYPGGIAGASLTRRVFDQLLIDAAVAAGVTFDDGVAAESLTLDGDRVVGATLRCGTTPAGLPLPDPIAASTMTSMDHGGARVTTDCVRARVVIGAEGRAAHLARSQGLSVFARVPRRWAFGAYYEGVAALTTRGEMHVRPGGYIGIAPLPGGLANVCVVRERATLHEPREQDVIGAAVSTDPALRERFVGARRVADVTVLGPLAVDASAAGTPGFLLAGDAAGFVDPMTGDGLRFAIAGGLLAADAARRELETGEPAYRDLQRARHQQFAAKWRVNRALRLLVGSPASVTLASTVARVWGAPVRGVVALAGDVALAREAGPAPAPAEA